MDEVSFPLYVGHIIFEGESRGGGDDINVVDVFVGGNNSVEEKVKMAKLLGEEGIQTEEFQLEGNITGNSWTSVMGDRQELDVIGVKSERMIVQQMQRFLGWRALRLLHSHCFQVNTRAETTNEACVTLLVSGHTGAAPVELCCRC